MIVSVKPFQPSVMLAGSGWSLTLELAPGHTHKQLEGLARDKHSSLSGRIINYDEKSFVNKELGLD